MRKKISLFAAMLVLVGSFAVSNMSISDAQTVPKTVYPDYKQGAFVEDNCGTCVFVCPHSLAESSCV